jgi:hypothetical protein
MTKIKKLKFMGLLAAVAGMAFAQQEITMPTEKGNITLLMNGMSPDSIGAGTILDGAVRNDTPFRLSFLMFELVGYNASGFDIKACGTIGGCGFYVFDPIDSDSSVRLRSPGNFILFRSTLKQSEVAKWEFRMLELSYFIKYDIRSSPVVNEKFAIASTFNTFNLHGIGLEFRNTSSDVIEVSWDQSVYIDEDGSSSRLIRGNVNLAEKDRPQPNTVIPRARNFRKRYSRWTILDKLMGNGSRFRS